MNPTETTGRAFGPIAPDKVRGSASSSVRRADAAQIDERALADRAARGRVSPEFSAEIARRQPADLSHPRVSGAARPSRWAPDEGLQ